MALDGEHSLTRRTRMLCLWRADFSEEEKRPAGHGMDLFSRRGKLAAEV